MEVDGSFFFSLLYFCRNKAPQVWFLSSEVWQGPSSKSEAVIASEHLHQRTLEGNGGIKMGTAGTYRRAGRFFFFFFLTPGHCSICAPPAPLRASRQAHGQQALPYLLIGSCHGDAGSQCWEKRKNREWGWVGVCCKSQHAIFLI